MGIIVFMKKMHMESKRKTNEKQKICLKSKRKANVKKYVWFLLLKEYNMTRQRRVVMRETRNLEYKRQIANTWKMVIESKCPLEICLTFFKIRNIISYWTSSRLA